MRAATPHLTLKYMGRSRCTARGPRGPWPVARATWRCPPQGRGRSRRAHVLTHPGGACLRPPACRSRVSNANCPSALYHTPFGASISGGVHGGLAQGALSGRSPEPPRGAHIRPCEHLGGTAIRCTSHLSRVTHPPPVHQMWHATYSAPHRLRKYGHHNQWLRATARSARQQGLRRCADRLSTVAQLQQRRQAPNHWWRAW